MTDPAFALEPDPDRALVARWQHGDQAAARLIVERHSPALARYAASLGVWDEAEELVQDTFVRAFGSLDGFRHDASLRTWLFTILKRLVLDRRRAAGRGRRVEPLSDDVPTAGPHPIDGLLADETERRIAGALQRLTRMQRDVFTLRVSEGLSYREIAGVLGSTEGAARVHYHNALRAVKEALDD